MRFRVVLLLACLVLFGEELPELLQTYRRRVEVCAGDGVGRSAEQVWRERRGNCDEITNGFRSFLEEHGIETSIHAGEIAWSGEQKSFWGDCFPLPRRLSWLNVQDMLLPDFGLRRPRRSFLDGVRGNLYPWLTGRTSLLADAGLPAEQVASLQRIARKKQVLDGMVEFFPTEELSEAWSASCRISAGRWLERGKQLQRSIGFPGYLCDGWLTTAPVEVTETETATLPKADIRISLRTEEGVVLDCSALQMELCGNPDGALVQFRWESDGELLKSGDEVLLRRVIPCVVIGEEEQAGVSVGFGETLWCQVTREVGDAVTDRTDFSLKSGEECRILFSTGSSLFGDGIAHALRNADALSRLFCLAGEIVPTENLRVCLCKREWEVARFAGLPRHLETGAETIGFPVCDGEWRTQAGHRRLAGLARALVPFLLLEKATFVSDWLDGFWGLDGWRIRVEENGFVLEKEGVKRYGIFWRKNGGCRCQAWDETEWKELTPSGENPYAGIVSEALLGALRGLFEACSDDELSALYCLLCLNEILPEYDGMERPDDEEEWEVPPVQERNVRLVVPGLFAKDGILGGEREIIAYADGDCSLRLLCNGVECARSAGAVLCVPLDSATWEDGHYTLQAVAELEGRQWESDRIAFYYSRHVPSSVSPEVTFSASVWPPWEGVVTARTKDDCQLQAWQDGVLRGEGKDGVLELAGISREQWNRGIEIRCVDEEGMATVKRLAIPPSGGDGADFQVSVMSDDYAREVLVVGTEELLHLEVHLNGEEISVVSFPGESAVLIALPVEDVLEGRNLLAVHAWNAGGFLRDCVAEFTTDAFVDCHVEPKVLRPWMDGTEEFRASASLRAEHPWRVELVDEEERSFVSRSGIGRTVEVALSPKGLADGDYRLRVSLEDCGVVREFPVEWDGTRGTPVASIDYPSEEGVTDAGLLTVRGSVGSSEADENATWELCICDGEGKVLASVRGEGRGMGGEVGTLDLSGIPNGRYLLRLAVESNGQRKSVERPFTLESRLKLGEFTFQEEDFVAYAGRIPIHFIRRYDSLDLSDCGYGAGWRGTLSAAQPELDEVRQEMTDMDGERCSVRSGGGRNVTVTLTDGRRVTFVYSLAAGGSLSFTSYARWSCPGGGATLTPVCSSRLVTLPGLPPYWEAAGMDTPMEVFDFPGFDVMEADGTVMHLVREEQGLRNILSGGEAIAVALYGALRLGGIDYPDGRRIVFGKDAVLAREADGEEIPVVEFSRDEGTGRVRLIRALGGTEMRFAFTYDDEENLVGCDCAAGDGPWRTVRSYEYGRKDYPHHLTRILREDETPLVEVGYDLSGRRNLIRNAEGDATRWEGDAAAGVEVRKDAMGRETLVRFDAAGRISSCVYPNGRNVRYQYDAAGRESVVYDGEGYRREMEYDGSGNLKSVTFADGGRREYSYTGKLCTGLTDEGGRNYRFAYDAGGRLSEFRMPNGHVRGYARDASGRTVSLTQDGRETQWMQYDRNGFLSHVGSAYGTLLEQKPNNFGKLEWQRFSFHEPDTGEVRVMVQEYEYDGQGREIRVFTSDGQWLERGYGSTGLVERIRESNGNQEEFWYDAEDRIVQRRSRDLVARYGYDSLGRLAFHGETTAGAGEEIPAELECTGARYDYGADGMQMRETRCTGMRIALAACGAERYRTELRAGGTEVARRVEEQDRLGRVVRMRTGAGRLRESDYDAMGNVVAERDGSGEETRYAYSSNGQLARVEHPDGGTEERLYDASGHLREIVLPDGNRLGCRMDLDGRLLLRRDGYGRETVLTRDEDGLLLRVSEGGQEWNYEYDSLMGLCGVEDSLGRRTEILHDGLGREVLCRTPLGNSWRTAYMGTDFRPVERTTPEGCRVAMEYDSLGRCIRQQAFRDGILEGEREYCYDVSGRLSKMASRSCGVLVEEIENSYDPLYGWLNAQSRNGVECRYSHDADGCPTGRESLSWGWTMTEAPSGRERVTQCRSTRGVEGSGRFRGEVDFRGEEVRVERPDGSRVETERDLCGRPTVVREVDSTGGEMASLAYVYGKNGEMQEEKGKGAAGEFARRFFYDDAGRLVFVESESGGGARRERFAYDAAGNRVFAETEAGGTVVRRDFLYDADDRLVEERRDARKRLLSWDHDGQLCCAEWIGETERTDYEWTADGMLRAVLRTFPDGTRATVRFLYGAEGELCADQLWMRRSDGSERTIRREFEFAGGVLAGVSILDGDCGEKILWRRDGTLGSGVWESLSGGAFHLRNLFCDALGTVRTREMRGAWGERESALSSADEIPADGGGFWGFTGAWEDGVTGLVYLKSRFYSPEWGIFLSRDLRDFDQTRPRTWNRHAYCGGDPVNCTDPTGGNFITSILNWGIAPLRFVATGIYDLLFVPEAEAALWMEDLFLNTPKERDSAAVIVHGVGVHAKEYAFDFRTKLHKLTNGYLGGWDNQDYYEFLWSGFSLFGNLPMMIPNRMQHEMALQSLMDCLGILLARGYWFQNILSHSWGTVLSRDAFEEGVVHPTLWVTMGSPLPTGKRAGFPHFDFRKWMNFYYWNDPVAYLMLDGPGASLKRATQPLFMYKYPNLEHQCLWTGAAWSHSLYWEDLRVLMKIVNLWGWQL